MASCVQNSWQELLTRTLELTILVVQCAQWLAASFASSYLTVEMMLLVINPVCFHACSTLACSTLARAWGVLLLSLLNVMTKLQNPNSQLSSSLLTKEVWVWWQAACRTLDKNSWQELLNLQFLWWIVLNGWLRVSLRIIWPLKWCCW